MLEKRLSLKSTCGTNGIRGSGLYHRPIKIMMASTLIVVLGRGLRELRLMDPIWDTGVGQSSRGIAVKKMNEFGSSEQARVALEVLIREDYNRLDVNAVLGYRTLEEIYQQWVHSSQAILAEGV